MGSRKTPKGKALSFSVDQLEEMLGVADSPQTEPVTEPITANDKRKDKMLIIMSLVAAAFIIPWVAMWIGYSFWNAKAPDPAYTAIISAIAALYFGNNLATLLFNKKK